MAPHPSILTSRTVAGAASRARMCKDGRWMCLLESMCRRIGWTFVSGQAARPSPSRAMTRVSSVSSSGLRAFDESAPIPCRIVDIDHSRSAGAPASRRNAEERFGRANRRFARRHQQILGPRVRRPPAFDPSARRREAKGPAPVGLLRGAKARAPVWAMSAPLSGPPRASKRRGHPYASRWLHAMTAFCALCFDGRQIGDERARAFGILRHCRYSR
jgi:hypothetical protein